MSLYRVNSYISRNSFRKDSYSDIRNIRDEVPIKTCFNSFLCEYGSKNTNNNLICSYASLNKKNEIFQKIYSKRKAINNLYKVKDTVFSNIIGKPVSLKYLELGMKKIFFGPDGFITNKVNFLKKVYKKKRDFHIGLDTRIYAGNLDYLDLRTKNSYNNRVDEAKRAYFTRSSNFAVAINKNDKGNSNYKNNKNKNKRNKIENKRTFSKFNLTTSSDNIQLEDSKRKVNSFTQENKKIKLLSNEQKNKVKNKIKLKLKNRKLNLNLLSPKFKSNRILSGLTSPKHYTKIDEKKIAYDRKKNQKLIKKTKKELKLKINSLALDEPLSEKESDLYSFLDNSNPFKKIYEVDSKEEKIMQDIEIITNMKITDEKTKAKATNKLIDEIDNDKFRFSILRLSDGIRNLNEDTALKLANEITNNYLEETQGSYISQNGNTFKKPNYDIQLRNNCSSNLKKMERMAFSLDLLKSKFHLNQGSK